MIAIPVTQEQFDLIEDAWYLASYPSCRRVRDPWWLDRFDAAVEAVTGIDVRGADFTLERSSSGDLRE